MVGLFPSLQEHWNAVCALFHLSSNDSFAVSLPSPQAPLIVAGTKPSLPAITNVSDGSKLLGRFPIRKQTYSSVAPEALPEPLVGLSEVRRVDSNTAPELALGSMPIPTASTMDIHRRFIADEIVTQHRTRASSASSNASTRSAFMLRTSIATVFPIDSLRIDENFNLDGGVLDFKRPYYLLFLSSNTLDFKVASRVASGDFEFLITIHSDTPFASFRGMGVRPRGHYQHIPPQRFSFPRESKLTFTLPSDSVFESADEFFSYIRK